MRSVPRGRLARLSLVGLLLLPWAPVALAAAPCAVTAPDLGVDVGRACAAVLSAVPGWDGRATVVLADGDESVAAEALGSVVTVHPGAWAGLSAAGRQEVLTHELVHVATDPFTSPRTPQWLVEGLAEAVALRGSGLADRVAAQELAAQVRAGRVPDALPTSAEFAAAPALAYQESWLAVDLLVQQRGLPAVLRLYQAPSDRLLDRGFVRAWRAELVRRLA